ncbi:MULTISPECIES: hypothetical protein [unclassified Rhodococcus (in: high G+C Gram-positive bacteria)]|uniref:hypothetical protein n=1 Tax=unclassified Rhodococcus (in: high G+C Gram-positive bacteria) TaxID=192944 RepID=UPI00163AFFEB|nr:MULTISPECIES: hypothetical protein [unclassified Rhodococcus (in: high G+C Gram-positive bacteria)]MBC2637788.1 hypothetical protein [Rhodococcus sp. 3A]MBC2897467.1 hypothetical protein [Rhodococcus sp. 4CII]
MVTFDETDLGIEAPKRTNVCAIVALFCALTGLFVPALVFGAIGYVETGGREYETGSGIAVAALILGAIELTAVVVTAAIVLVSLH